MKEPAERVVGTSGFAQREPRAGSETEQVWAEEQAYWRYVEAHDVTNYLALWSEGFVGWPHSDEHPIGKAAIVAMTAGGSLAHTVFCELHRESVEMHGPAAIAFYRATVRQQTADGSESATTYRMTHTWMKHDGRWQIVGGMSALETMPARSSTP